METKIEKTNPPTTYTEAINNLEHGFHSLGKSLTLKEQDSDTTYHHPLEMIVRDFADQKAKYFLFHSAKDFQPETLVSARNTRISPLRKVIHNAIATLPVEELADITIDNGVHQKISLIAYLAEIGEIKLFKAAFTKIKPKLNDKDFLNIYKNLYYSYEGTKLSETIGLSSYLLKRGNWCYVAMAEWMLNELHKEQFNIQQFMDNFLSEIKINKNNLATLLHHEKVYITLDEYNKQKWNKKIDITVFELDESRFKAEAEKQYHQLVTQYEQKHLFLKHINDYYTQDFKSLNTYADKIIQPSFILNILTSNTFKITAFVLVLAGIIGLTIGSLGIAGLIAALAGTATLAVVSASGATLGIGLGMSTLGFFAAQSNNIPNEIEKEHSYFVEAYA